MYVKGAILIRTVEQFRKNLGFINKIDKWINGPNFIPTLQSFNHGMTITWQNNRILFIPH